jgi:hypothetical protein
MKSWTRVDSRSSFLTNLILKDEIVKKKYLTYKSEKYNDKKNVD